MSKMLGNSDLSRKEYLFLGKLYLSRRTSAFGNPLVSDGRTSGSFLPCQMEAIVVIILQIFFATCSNQLEYLNISFKNSLPSKMFRAYAVFWYCFIDQQVYLSFWHKSKPFLHLDINFNCKQDAPWSFWNWEMSLGEYHWIFPSFSWGIFGHMRRLDQLRASENIWWIIMCFIHTLLQNPTTVEQGFKPEQIAVPVEIRSEGWWFLRQET